MTTFIPVNEPLLDGNEKKYLIECIESGWISSEGPFVQRFEEQLAARVDRQYGIAVSSGTAALEVAVAALGIGQGDEVILPTFTIISCALAIVRAGAVPVPVDCDPLTWNMNTDAVAAAVTPRTKAIMPVHIYGLPVDMEPILAIASRFNLAIIEDAAQALGQTYRGQPCGSFGELSVFSFYPNKMITTGEGGMIVTNDQQLAARCRSLRNLCFQSGKRFVHEEMGWNFRMTNLQAAVGLAQFEQLDRHLKMKRSIGQHYERLFANVTGLQLPLPKTDYAENHYWVYGVVLDEAFGLNAAEAMQEIGKMGVGTRPFFWPIHQQPLFKNRQFFNSYYGCSERIARQGWYIPSGLNLSRSDCVTVVSAIIKILTKRS
jgi:perosamine synthetase